MNLLLVSLPRSGSGYLRKAMLEMWGERYKPCKGYKEQVFDPEEHNSLKSHDFALDVQPLAQWGVVLQWRDPLDAVPSWFNYCVERDGLEDSYEMWKAWSHGRFIFAGQLYRKWINHPRVVMTIDHARLQSDPENTASAVGRLMFGWDIDPARLKTKPRPATNHRKFRHYRVKDFAAYSAMTQFPSFTNEATRKP